MMFNAGSEEQGAWCHVDSLDKTQEDRLKRLVGSHAAHDTTVAGAVMWFWWSGFEEVWGSHNRRGTESITTRRVESIPCHFRTKPSDPRSRMLAIQDSSEANQRRTRMEAKWRDRSFEAYAVPFPAALNKVAAEAYRLDEKKKTTRNQPERSM